ncbi:uncharacterized protein LOC132300927 [Cornus florida]|uniref:uncharacterized protein LOC132300927 n=1 Tax=Cornus florida TaxID=4283 RepID=UPI002899C6C0|nr:uncharacterized protein LOC132300927 [Cornus florida]
MRDNPNRTLPKLMVWFTIFISFSYIFYTLRFTHSYRLYTQNPLTTRNQLQPKLSNVTDSVHKTPVITEYENPNRTQLKHIVFGIGGSAKLWDHRQNYIKLWWRPNEMRGFVWLDQPVNNDTQYDDTSSLPPLKISSEISKFDYTNPKGDRSGIRISRIVSEMVRLEMEDVRWLVMGDDDTMFFPDNLPRVLQKYDHNQFYYIGSTSESHLQNIYFSYNMAYGGGGFAISYPLAKALAKIQDTCIQRYPNLYGSDDRIQACMAELGVPLTKEIGFHQCDMYGNIFGFLAAHPVAPLVSLHHLDLVDPIFPGVDRVQALERLKLPTKLDSAGLLQQSICYDQSKKWTISVSWGYAVQIFQFIIPAREMEIPRVTFLNWHRKADYTAFAFNTRPVHEDACEWPYIYVMSNALYDPFNNRTASEYVQVRTPPRPQERCWWKMADPSHIQRVEVYKKPDPHLWDKSPRRNCCRVLPSKKKGTIAIDVGECREGETIN